MTLPSISQITLSSSTINMEGAVLELDRASISDLYPEFDAIAYVADAETSSHIFLDYGFRHEQTDTGSLPQVFGGEVGLENFAQNLRFNAAGIIGYGHLTSAVFLP